MLTTIRTVVTREVCIQLAFKQSVRSGQYTHNIRTKQFRKKKSCEPSTSQMTHLVTNGLQCFRNWRF